MTARAALRPGLYAAAALAALFTALLALAGGLKREEQHIDLASGRKRVRTFVLMVPVSTTAEETWLSRTLNSPAREPDWRPVNTFTGSGPSPYHRYHGAFSQIDQAERLLAMARFTPEAERALARALLDRWVTGGVSHAAADLLERLSETAFEAGDAGREVTEADVAAAVSAAAPPP